MIGIILILIIYLVIALFFASFMKKAAELKGYDNSAHIFEICFWFGIFGCLYVIALPDLKLREQNEHMINLLSNNTGDKSNNVNYEELPPL